MKVEDFRLKVEKECRSQGLPKPEILEERLGSMKLRIGLTHDVRIDLYFNEDTKTMTSALVVKEKRVLGINGYPRAKQWHLRPEGNVQKHVPRKIIGIEILKASHLFKEEGIEALDFIKSRA